jgi:ankyrin repeat protein
MADTPLAPQELLAAAAARGDLRVLTDLLREGDLCPDAPDRYGITPLMEGCSAGKLSAAILLIERGANVNAADKERNTVLMHACRRRRNRKIVGLLLSLGAAVNRRDADGRTALMTAAAKGDVDVVRLLLAWDADVNAVSKHQETAVTFAIVWDRLPVVAALLAAGADVNWSDDPGWTPLKYAMFEKNTPIAKVLQKYGALLAGAD